MSRKLTRADRFRKCPLKCVANLPRFRSFWGPETFSRARCSKRDVHLLAGLVGWQAGLEPGLGIIFRYLEGPNDTRLHRRKLLEDSADDLAVERLQSQG